MISQIEGVQVFQFPVFADERGEVYKLPHNQFPVKDVYTTTVRQGAIKAWHGYETKHLLWSVVGGVVRLGLYDSRLNSPTYGVSDTFFLGRNAPWSVLVPPGVFNGFKGISHEDGIIVVQADEEYVDAKVIRVPYDEYPYDWSIQHG